MKKIAFLSSGKSRGSNFCAVIDYIHKKKLPIDVSFLAVTDKNAPIVEKATGYGVEVYVISTKEMTIYEAKLLEVCLSKKIELIALSGFLKRLSSGFIKSFGKPILNIHPALLPKYGGKGMYGMNVHRQVFEAGERYSGVTIHYVNAEYDSGAIIKQQQINIEDCRTPQEIAQKVLNLEHKLYAPTINKVLFFK